MSYSDALASHGDRQIGSLIDINNSSFHTVMHITTCGGGMATTNIADPGRPTSKVSQPRDRS
jgi:dTDP-4-amino-4,6-dideoxygalactose transaminase